MQTLTANEAKELLDQIVQRGAEVEQRATNGDLIFFGGVDTEPVTIDTYKTDEGDERMVVLMAPVPLLPDDLPADAVIPYDHARRKPLRVTRFDLIANHTVGMSSIDGTVYTVVRPISDERVRHTMQAWMKAVAEERVG